MGSRATRILREEFLIPPEFQGLELAKSQAARIGGASFELVKRGGETQLGGCFQQVPIRMMPPFSFGGEVASLTYLINLTAGLMDGDGHLVEVVAREGTAGVVTGQSATRIHPALDSFCTQQWKVQVEDDACLVVLPGPAIPYQNTRYYQRGRVEMAPRARLIWGDIWLAGRYERGALSERFVFQQIVQDLEVRRADRLVYRDRFRWDGPWSEQEATWYFGGELATGNLYVSDALLSPFVDPFPALPATVFPLGLGGYCLRWCGHPTLVTEALVQTAMRIAADWTSGPSTPTWLLESSELSPIHWFSPAPKVQDPSEVRADWNERRAAARD